MTGRYDQIHARSLKDPARDYHYELDVHEIIVEGDLAVVRLTWTLFVTPLVNAVTISSVGARRTG